MLAGAEPFAAGLQRSRRCLIGRQSVVQQLRTDVMDAALRQPLPRRYPTHWAGDFASLMTLKIRDLYVTAEAARNGP